MAVRLLISKHLSEEGKEDNLLLNTGIIMRRRSVREGGREMGTSLSVVIDISKRVREEDISSLEWKIGKQRLVREDGNLTLFSKLIPP